MITLAGIFQLSDQEVAVGSDSKQTSTIRNKKDANKGKRRKAKLRTEGTTRTPAELFGDE